MGVITEHAVLTIDPQRADEFEKAFAQAVLIPERSPGFVSGRLLKGVESPGTYLLLFEWESVEAHVVGFRESPAMGEWRALVGPFFVTPPVVEHFDERARTAR